MHGAASASRELRREIVSMRDILMLLYNEDVSNTVQIGVDTVHPTTDRENNLHEASVVARQGFFGYQLDKHGCGGTRGTGDSLQTTRGPFRYRLKIIMEIGDVSGLVTWPGSAQQTQTFMLRVIRKTRQ